MGTVAFLADTSVWINFFNGRTTPAVSFLVKSIELDREVFLCPIIVQEILQGLRSDRDFELVKAHLLGFPVLDWHPLAAAISAAELFRNLRKQGITIRKSNDCLIAAFALKFDLALLQEDRDFPLIARGSGLKLVAT